MAVYAKCRRRCCGNCEPICPVELSIGIPVVALVDHGIRHRSRSGCQPSLTSTEIRKSQAFYDSAIKRIAPGRP